MTILKEPLKKHRCPRCNADLTYEHKAREERWVCTNPICREVWVFPTKKRTARSA